MKEGLTDITLILDRSESMEPLADETIAGVNAFLVAQNAQAGEATFSLVQFADDYETVHWGVPLSSVPPIIRESFVPRGTTALLDALGRTIDRMRGRFTILPEAERPARVVVAVVTDGQENASEHYAMGEVARMIRLLQDQHSWTFIFLGAGLDVIADALELGTKPAMVSSYRPDRGTLPATFDSLAHNVSRVRSGDRTGFTDEERERMN